jgi:PAS domain S-box-containing protein
MPQSSDPTGALDFINGPPADSKTNFLVGWMIAVVLALLGATALAFNMAAEMRSVVLMSLYVGAILSAIGCWIAGRAIIEPIINDVRQAKAETQDALSRSQDHAAALSAVIERFNLHREVLEKHALVSETDAEGRFTYVNDSFCRISGYSREELLGQPHSIINDAEHDDGFWQAMHQIVSSGQVWQSEVSNLRKNGEPFYLIQTIAAVRNDAGKLIGYVNIGADITEQKKLQEEIVRKNKLAQLGQLTSTVAHEIRNPLGAVRTSTYLIGKKLEKSGVEIDFTKEFTRINTGIKRCDKIITQLLDFSRSKLRDAKSVIIDTWVREVVEEERDNIPDRVRVQLDLNVDLHTANIDADQMYRVLVNLINNSVEAMVGRPNSPVATPTENPSILISTHLVGRNIELSVRDNGPGITDENLAKIREPLYSTKSFGVGLGIPAVDKILENHDGGLRIDTEIGCGTTMTAWFPAALEAEETTIETVHPTSGHRKEQSQMEYA